jgi:hypothetical protein
MNRVDLEAIKRRYEEVGQTCHGERDRQVPGPAPAIPGGHGDGDQEECYVQVEVSQEEREPERERDGKDGKAVPRSSARRGWR